MKPVPFSRLATLAAFLISSGILGCEPAGGWLPIPTIAAAGAQLRFEDFLRRRSRPGPNEAPEESDEFERDPELDRYRNAADAAYQQRDYAKAIQMASLVIEEEPEHPFAYYQRASARIEMGKRQGSLALIRAGITDAREGLRLGGKAYPFLYVPYFYGMTALAELENKPDYAQVTIDYGTPVLRQPDLKDSDRAHLLYQRGLAYRALKKYSLAVADFAAAVRYDDKLTAAYAARAQTLLLDGQTAAARKALDEFIAAMPREPLAWNERGSFRQQQGEHAAAIADFTQAISLDGKFATAYVNRGYTLSLTGDDAAAEADLLESVKLDSTNAAGWRLLGSARVAQGKARSAQNDFNNALRLTPRYAEAYADRGFARYYLGDYKGAAADFRSALEYAPGMLHLGLWRFAAAVRVPQQEAAARSELEAFLKSERGPKGWVAKVGEYQLGRISAEKLLELARQNPEKSDTLLCDAHFFIAAELQRQGDRAAAEEHFRACLTSSQKQFASYRGARYALSDFGK